MIYSFNQIYLTIYVLRMLRAIIVSAAFFSINLKYQLVDACMSEITFQILLIYTLKVLAVYKTFSNSIFTLYISVVYISNFIKLIMKRVIVSLVEFSLRTSLI